MALRSKAIRGTLLALACLTSCGAAMKQSFDALTGSYASDFQVSEIAGPIVKGPADFLIDVRTREEQSVSIIPGAILMTPDDDLNKTPGFQEFMNQMKNNSGARIIVYCAGGYRSARSLSRLKAEHPELIIPAYNLRGGIIAHANAGGELVRQQDQRATLDVHGYSAFWKKFVLPPNSGVDVPAIPAEKNSP